MLKSGRFLFMCLVLLGISLSYEASAATPTVTTPTSANVAATSATLGGNVTSDGGGAITERGVVYAPTGTNSDPLIGGTGVVKATKTGTTGVFTIAVTGLTQSTPYSFKAYATNSVGTSYSSVATCTTTPPDPTGAAGLVVTTNSDVSANDGLITLREAVVYANSGNAGATPEITFSVTGIIQLVGSADLVITKNLSIAGPGAGILTVKAGAGYAVGIFDIRGGIVSISGLTLSDGNGHASSAQQFGGALYISGGTATLANCTFSNNSAQHGGAIYVFGGSLAVTGCTISTNNAGTVGYGGGIYVSAGSLAVVSSTISGNTAGWGGGLTIAGGTVTIASSTISGNTAKDFLREDPIRPGVYYSDNGNGGGMFIGGGTVTVTNSTISGNRAEGTNAIFGSAGRQPGYEGGGGICNGSTLTVANSTVTDNYAVSGAGGGINTVFGTTPLQLSNSILANNTSGTDLACAGSGTGTASGNYNLVQNGATITGTNNITGQPALLGSLANNGGPTKTHALLAGSPALNAGSNALIASGVTTDQRGFARVDGGTVDIGACESDTPPTINLSAPSVTIANASSVVNYTVTYNDAGFNSSTLSTGNVTLNQTGTANATVSVDSSSGTTRTVTLSGITGNGTLGISIAAGTASDTTGNTAPAAGPGSTVNVDAIAPSVTINQAVGQTDPTISTPLSFTVVFSEPVTNFTTGDVSLSGSAGATTATVTGSGSTYSVAVTGMTQSGTVTATIATGVVLDAAANVNSASTSTDNAVSYSSAETVRNSGNLRPVEGGGYGLDCLGNPGQEYLIQFSPDLAPDSWQTLRTQVANSSGVVSIVDTPPAGTTKRFYRIVLP